MSKLKSATTLRERERERELLFRKEKERNGERRENMSILERNKGIALHNPSARSGAGAAGIASHKPSVGSEAGAAGLTLIALVVTIIVILILAGITLSLIIGENGLINRAKDAGEETKEKSAIEKVQLMLADYMAEKYTGTKTLEEYLNEQKEKGQLDEVTNNGEGTFTVEVDEYEIAIKEDDLSIVSTEKAEGIKPTIEVIITKTDGTNLTGDETKKAITVNIINIAEYGENYTIEVKDEKGNKIEKEANVITEAIGQASYIINKSGSYTIIVTGTKGEITRTTIKTETIEVVMEQIEETEMFSKANGVIDIVWLNIDNTVREEPISPANYLGGLTAIKYNGTDEVAVSDPTNDDSWYNYKAQTGMTDGKTSNWANARSSDSNAYFVWIPRYAYKITYFDKIEHANAYRENGSTEGIVGYSTIHGLIDVASGTEKLIAGSEPTNVIGTVQNEEYSDYIPHPAFEFDEAKAGIWVGKYESSGSKETVLIKPNTSSLRSISVGNIVIASQGVKDRYNLVQDSHMMKNTEWGAIAYLTESRYGRNGTEVTMNRNGSYLTGGGNYQANVLQSTTGNIYGIYDMNGSSWEYVAGMLSSKLSNDSNYDFSNSDVKYYNTYTSYSESKGIKGDGIYETSTVDSGSSSWHQDYSYFLEESRPVFMRGRLS